VSKQAVDYSYLGRWISDIPTHCAHPTDPHRLSPGRMISGWVECGCGGHRTVQCLSYDGENRCNAVHYLPARRPACSRTRAASGVAVG
jgi:hypothetical protein